MSTRLLIAAKSFVFLILLLAWSQPALGGNPTSITLAWDPSPGAAGYRVYEGLSCRVYTNRVDVGTNTTITFTGLVPGVTYYFAATAYDAYGSESDYSDELVYTVPAVAGVQISLHFGTAPGGQKQLVLSSAASSGSSYEVQTTHDLKTWTSLASVSANSLGQVLYTNAVGTNAMCFYRLRQTSP